MPPTFGERLEPEVEKTRAGLVTLVNEGFIKLPVAGANLGNFLTELAREYVRLRNEAAPGRSKLDLLKDAVENVRGTTSNTLLNKQTAPTASASISVLENVPNAFFGSRSIGKYLDGLA